MSELICIKTYATRMDAELAKAVLEANGVPAMVSADDLGGWFPGMPLPYGGGVRLLVPKEHVEEAAEVLKDDSQSHSESEY